MNGLYTFDDVSVVMETGDEEAIVGSILDEIAAVTEGRATVICVGGSSDRTSKIAADRGGRIIRRETRGDSEAVRRALAATDRPVVVTMDCDDSYPIDRLRDFLDLVNVGYDVVSGDRSSDGVEPKPRLNWAVNRTLTLLASVLVGRRLNDVTSGMRAYRREVIETIEWTENAGLSAELLLRPVARDFDVIEVPIDYRARAGTPSIDSLSDGVNIAKSIVSVGVEERFPEPRSVNSTEAPARETSGS